VPYSCSAWIHSIHSGIDVARASGLDHVAGCTGSTSERAVQKLYGLPDEAMLDMGDFVGGLLKYLRRHPVPRLTLGGGFAKMSKLAMGHLDLHSGRSQVDCDWLAERLGELGAGTELQDQVRGANTANQALELARQAELPLGDAVAQRARSAALDVLDGATQVEVLIFNRQGEQMGRAGG
jgi:cobalt-precorrin-5B (C1)-methyltransferase